MTLSCGTVPHDNGHAIWFGISSTLMCWCPTQAAPPLMVHALVWLGLTEGGQQGDLVSPPVIRPGQPAGQLHVTAAKPGGWLRLCCSETWDQLYYPGGTWLAKGKWPVTERIGSLLMMNFRFICKQKKLFTQILLLLDVYLWCVGCRNLGQPKADT